MRQYCNFNQAQALVNYGLNEKNIFLVYTWHGGCKFSR